MCLFAVATRCEFRRVSICSNIFFFAPAPIEIRTFATPLPANQPTKKLFVIFVKKIDNNVLRPPDTFVNDFGQLPFLRLFLTHTLGT